MKKLKFILFFIPLVFIFCAMKSNTPVHTHAEKSKATISASANLMTFNSQSPDTENALRSHLQRAPRSILRTSEVAIQIINTTPLSPVIVQHIEHGFYSVITPPPII